MFTGIVEETGVVRDVTADEGGRRIRVGTDRVGDFHAGQSVAVSGVCLTVEDYGADWFEVFTAAETLDVTYLGDLTPGDPVNVERALPADGRLDGHFVQGHVDGTTTVTAIESVGEDWRFEFALPDGYERYVAHKGSIAFDGVSLTVAGLDDDAGTFAVAVIPATYDATTLGAASVGDPVHVEVDVLAKYVERLLAR
jgi:riboflavin synthase